MKRRKRSGHRPKLNRNPGETQSIDAQYGLEPVIEPGSSTGKGDASGGADFHQVHCPYCGEYFETRIDTSSGSSNYIEDCQVCCQPIEFSLEVDHAGALVALATRRND
jgi:hypothetical protein